MNQYYSQNCQDKFIDRFIFRKKTDGFFIDIGAYDGITFSNTYFFEKNRKWDGICIEPLPERFIELKENRKCLCINVCVNNLEGEVDFLHVVGPSEMLSGIFQSYANEHISRINSELQNLGGAKKLIKVKAINLNNLLINNEIKFIDYLSIDVEGNELMILKTIDFSNIKIKSISVEDNYKSNELHKFLISQGFHYIGRLDADKIFVNDDIKSIFKLKLYCLLINYLNKLRRKFSKKI